MADLILKCLKCQKYTLQSECSQCGAKTIAPKPPKFSPQDKYGHLRREVKKSELKEKGLY